MMHVLEIAAFFIGLVCTQVFLRWLEWRRMPFIYDREQDAITVHGVSVAIGVFKWFAKDANVGRKFQFVSKDKYGTITIRTLNDERGE